MKLLFDANLSPRLVGRLQELFPGSAHVLGAGMAHETPDTETWRFAYRNGFVIVTADSDFLKLSAIHGAPPWVVRLENCVYRTAQVEQLLRRHAILIADLTTSGRSSLVIRNA